jgi:S-adenosylmethionine-diacylglycerol 3-amino-3-carboxypropyl transferase
LNYEEFVVLMGVRNGQDRWGLYQRLRPEVPEDAREFWDNNQAIIDNGIVHCGRLEQYFQVFQKKFIAELVSEDAMKHFLSQEKTQAQADFFEKVFNHPKFVEAFKAYTSQDMIAEHGRDHSQFKFVEVEDVGQFFHDRFRHVCTDLPTKHNFYLEFLLTSNYADLTNGPAYLQPDNFPKLQSLMPRFHIKTKPLDACIEDHDVGHYSKANLSDLFEYLSEEQTEGFLKTLATGMREGGRIAYWNLLVPRARPESLAHILKPHRELSRELWKQDRAFFYGDFHIDEVTRG